VRSLISLLAALGVGFACLAADFAFFLRRAAAYLDSPPPPAAEAVVALTGASDARISAGVRLSGAYGVPLLVSGVHPDATSADIARISGVAVSEIDCCATLGRAAVTTEGNGAEAAFWARSRGFQRLVVVTSEYHMDRALTELRRAMPEAEFIPHAVASGRTPARDWLFVPEMRKRMFEEWLKFRAAQLRALGEARAGAPEGG